MDSENSKGWPHFSAWSSCSLFLLLPGDELMFSCSGWTLLQISGSNTGSAAALKCLAVSKYPLRKAVSTPSFAATLLEAHRSQKLKMFSDYKQQHWKVSRTDKLSFHYMKLLNQFVAFAVKSVPDLCPETCCSKQSRKHLFIGPLLLLFTVAVVDEAQLQVSVVVKSVNK